MGARLMDRWEGNETMSETDRNSFNYPYRSMTDFSDELYRVPFGLQLEAIPLGLGPTIEVVVIGDHVFALSGTSLNVLDARSFAPVARLDGLVSARQLAVNGNVAVVTARDAGVYIVDVSNPQAPRLAAHYDPVEFATGVHLARPDLAILTCRHYGLEFVDLTDPDNPRFVSSILVGEAQSVTSDGNIAYAGVWYEKELVLVDFSDAARPLIVGRSPLDGFGDGVHVRGRHAYVATGHHSARQRDPRHFEPARHITFDMFETGYGQGHGIEIHDIADPVKPRLLKRLKSPPSFVNSPDTWRVILHDDLLIHADAENGVFIHEMTGPEQLSPLAFAVLPLHHKHRQLPTLSLQPDRYPATGIAIAGSTLLIASSTSDLYRCALPAAGAAPQKALPSPFPQHYPDPDTPLWSEGTSLLNTDGQVHWVTSDGDVVFAAAGRDGLYMLDAASGEVLDRQDLDGIVQHVCCARGLIYVSQGIGGVSIWRRNGAALEQVGVWRDGPSIRQVVIPEEQPLGIAVAGPGLFAMLDLTDPSAPRRVATHQVTGLVYARLLADRLAAEKYAIGASQGGGINWFDLSSTANAEQRPRSAGARLCPITEGITVHEGQALVLQAGGYYFATPEHLQQHGEPAHIRETGRFFSGNPQSIGPDRLVVTNRATGSARILDITEPAAPTTLAYLHLPGNPDRPIRLGERLIFPCGRGGLRAVPCP